MNDDSLTNKTRKRPPIILTHAGVTWVDLQTAGNRLGRRPEAVIQMARKIGAVRKCGLTNVVNLELLRDTYAAKGKKGADKPDPLGYVSLKTLSSRGFSRASLLVMGISELVEFAIIDGVECVKDTFDIDAFVLSDSAKARSEAYATARDKKSQGKGKGSE